MMGASNVVASAAPSSAPPDAADTGGAVSQDNGSNAGADLTAPSGGARPKIRRPEATLGPTAFANGAGLYHDQIAPQVSRIHSLKQLSSVY